MAKRERLHLSRYQSIETYKDWNGRIFIACSGGSSRMFDNRKELLRFLKVAKGVPMRQVLDGWLDSLEAADAKRKGAEPLTSEEPVQPTEPSLSQEVLETGFGPECHEDDPALSTKMVI